PRHLEVQAPHCQHVARGRRVDFDEPATANGGVHGLLAVKMRLPGRARWPKRLALATSPAMSDVQARISDLIAAHPVVLFMKGWGRFPQCGFSSRVVSILDRHLPKYETVNVLTDPDIREGVKAFSQWPTIPKLYVRGKFVGGCDIVTEMAESGELKDLLG